MADLQTRLEGLGAGWDPPPTPDLVTGVLAARAASPDATRRTRPRRLVLALVASVVTIAALAAIAPARNAVLRFFDIGGVRIVTTTATLPSQSTPPPTTPGTAATNPLGQSISLNAARARAPFSLRLPTLPGTAPDRVFVQTPPRDGAFAFVWRDAGTVARRELVITQLRGTLVAEKALDPTVTRVQRVDVDSVSGYWLSGGPHTFGYLDSADAFRVATTRTVGDVLIWERSGITYRIEGAASRDTALRIAASLR